MALRVVKKRLRLFVGAVSVLWIGMIGYSWVPTILEHYGPITAVDVPYYVLYPEKQGMQTWEVAVATGELDRENVPGFMFVLGAEFHPGIIKELRRWNPFAYGTDDDVSHVLRTII